MNTDGRGLRLYSPRFNNRGYISRPLKNDAKSLGAPAFRGVPKRASATTASRQF